MHSELKSRVLLGCTAGAGGGGGAPRTPEAAGVHPATPRAVDSEEILRGQPEIEIDHAGVLYRLRVTSLGKLILTK